MPSRRIPGFEGLESRIAPTANLVDVGVLRFVADKPFTVDGTKYEVFDGSVSVGYVPVGTENYHPLISFSETDPALHSITIDTNVAKPVIDVWNAGYTMTVVALTGNQANPIPIWNSPDDHTIISIPQLINPVGASFNIADATAFKVAGGQFSLTGMSFNNPTPQPTTPPTPPTTAHSQVLLQGVINLPTIPILGDGVSLEVTDGNNVVIDDQSVSVTGVKATKSFGPKSVGDFNVSATVSFEYTSSDHTYTISGGGSVSSKDGSNTKMKNLAAQVSMSIVAGGDSPSLVAFGFEVGGSFSMDGLSVSTTQGQALSFQYDTTNDLYRVGGSLNVAFGESGDQQISLYAGGTSNPGFIFKQGELDYLQLGVQGSFTLHGVTFQSPGLTFMYQKAQGGNPSLFEMYGSVDLVADENAGEDQTIFQINFGTTSDNPGIEVVGGQITKLDIGIDGGGHYGVSGLSLTAFNPSIKWDRDSDTFVVGGTFGADFKVFQATVQLGTTPDTGLVIDHGKFSLSAARFSLSTSKLGPITIKDLVVFWNSSDTSATGYTLDINADVVIGGGLEAVGVFDMVNGQVTQVGLTIKSTEGVPIPGTGLKVTELGGLVQNINDPSHIVVTVHMDAIYGEQFVFGSTKVNLFRVEGDVTASAGELILGGAVQMGAYSNDGGLTWNAAAGEGDAKLTLDWAQQYYNLHVHVAGLFAIFDLTGDLTFRPGVEIDFLATANVVIPSEVPFIGGDTLGGLGFFFQHVFSPSTSTTVAGWIDIQVIWTIEIGIEYYVDSSGNHSVSVIGKDQIDQFGRDAAPPVNQTYTYTVDLSNQVPSGSTKLTFAVDWSKPQPGTTVIGKPTFTVIQTVGGNTITTPESSFGGTTISLVTDPLMNTSTKKALQVVGSTTSRFAPLAGSYQVQVSVTASGGNPFPNFTQQTGATAADYPDQLKVATTHEVPQPTFGPLATSAGYTPVVQAGPKGTFSVSLTGNMDLALLTGGSPSVSVYLVRTDDVNQTRKIKVGSVVPTTSTAPGVNWQAQLNIPTFGLDPFPYYLYATVNDGRNAPTKSANSLPFTPEFAFTGNLADQTGVVLSGWTVFLDYNANGVDDPNEPITTTSALGTYGFPPTYDPTTGWADVPVGKDVPVMIVLPSALYAVAQGNPQTMQYNGRAATSVNFTVERPATITGTVFSDTAGDGVASDGTPIPGQAVYLDANGNGQPDPGEQTAYADTYGVYQFPNLATGNYTVRVVPQTPVQAISAPQGTAGNWGFDWTYGEKFNAPQTVEITSLGVFVDAAFGVVQPLTSVLYDAVTHNVVASMTFTPSDPGTAVGAFHYKTLPQPIHVYAGFQGIIAAYGYGGLNSQQFAGRALSFANPPWSFSTDNGIIGFTGSSVSYSGGQFPDQTSDSSFSYAAGTFQFRTPAPVASSTSVLVHNVAITDPHQIASGNDFGFQPRASVSGAVTTAASPGATPQPTPGVPVNLYWNGSVVGATTTGSTGAYSFTDLEPGQYSVGQQVPSGLRQIAPVNTKASFVVDPSAGLISRPTFTPVTSRNTVAFYGNAVATLAKFQYPGNPNGSIASVSVTVDGLPVYSEATSMRGTPVGFINAPGSSSYVQDFYVLADTGAVEHFLGAGQVSNSTSLPAGGSIGSYRDLQLIDAPGSGSSSGAPTFWATLFTDPTGTKSGVGVFGSNTTGPSNPTAYLWSESNPARLVLADVNGDGIQDVVVNGPSTTPTVLLVHRDGSVTPETINALPPATGGYGLAGDVNKDGRVDLAVLASDGSMTLSLQNPDGTFSATTTLQVAAAGSRITYAAILDLNLNGLPALVLAGYDPGSTALSVRVSSNTASGPNYLQDVSQQTRVGVPGDPSLQYTSITLGSYINYPSRDALPMLAVFSGGSVNSYSAGVYIHNHSSLVAGPLALSLSSGDAETVNFENLGTAGTDPVVNLPRMVGSGDYAVAYRDGNIEVSDPAIGRLFSRAAFDLRSLRIMAHPGRAATITFDLSNGPVSLSNGILFVGAGADANTIRIIGRPTGSNFLVDPTGVWVDGVRVVHWAGLQSLQLIGGAGNDRFAVKGDPQLLSRLTIIGGGGRDVYSLAASHTNMTLIDPTGLGTLDFQAATSAVAVDLRLGAGQLQGIGAGGNVMSLYGSFANVYGTAYNDYIFGNALANVLLGRGGNDVIFGNGGDDYIDGGAGDDRLNSGPGRSIVVGGAGDDALVALGGRSLLIGGAGRDVLVSYPPGTSARPGDGSLLISGATAYDAHAAALQALLKEWTSNRSLSTRLRNLVNASGSSNRANANFVLNSRTLRPDASSNLFAATPGRDLLFPGARDRFNRF